ncbi:DNA segregation ATPase FtsK SpoIIIE related protein [Levilactobacillus paucivorans]|uniref:DNA translocase FtsK n=1 Tax=Levilactobacillus paucivorans TaxID=616990 RepID=A0A0R2LRU5_9LACO|nr:DNA segregation ATPase FtsK SpoIIIE related protein [Levilactobacillus paucivorans]
MKHRQERNERLKLRKQQEQERVAERQREARSQHETARQSQPKVTPQRQVSPVTDEPVVGSANQSYRPFQVTQVPKQLHWSRPTRRSRQRYQQLVAGLKKDDSSFFLFGKASDLPEATPATEVATQASSASTESEAIAAKTPTAVTSNQSAAVAATEPAVDATPVSTPTDEKYTAPVEVFYPTEDATSQANAVTESDELYDGNSPEYLPVGTVKATATAETTQVEDTQLDNSEDDPGSATPETTGQPASEAVQATDKGSGVTEANDTSDSEAPVSASSAAGGLETSATGDTTHETADSSVAEQPAEVAQLLERTQAPKEKTAATPASTKAKPARGLGHSLGDIMQEEGNDQRDLALFDRPTTPETTTEAETPERGYHFPDISLLPQPVIPDEAALDEWIEHQAEVLDATLSAFHVDAHVTDWTVGPTVTQFQISLALGVKVNKITNLNDDLKLALAAKDIRIEAPIPGKTTVGIEIPNLKSRPVMLSEVLNSPAFKKSESPLTVALGVDLFGKPQVTDLRKMPHGLIAGATGSGKSVFINSLLLSILYKANPQQVKLLLIDPKAVEMAPYDGLPHLLAPVISDPKAAAAALKWVVTEMDQRYEKLAAAGVRNIEQFNDRADANDEPGLKMPYIVIIIDELADLMMMAASEVQDYIVRITQKARAAGIHLLVATQRPSVDIVTGTIKNNIPTRIAFMVSSQIDSRTILDTAGAENLLGRGDMLYLGNGASQPMRLQGAFVESEVDAVADFVRTQGQPHYAFEPQGLLKRETAEENQDDLLPKVLEYVAAEQTVSTSKLQRVFSIGYNRAANLIDDLERHHYVSPQHGSKPREVYLKPEDLGKDLPEPHDQNAPFSS